MHVDFSSPVNTRIGALCGPSPPAVEAEIVHMYCVFGAREDKVTFKYELELYIILESSVDVHVIL